MLAPLTIPPEYYDWNWRHGAPGGHGLHIEKKKLQRMSRERVLRLKGPFGTQGNNSTREFEYPWCFFTAKLETGMRVLEIGGGLAGFQFALDAFGCRVVNVDPGMAASGVGWPCEPATMAKLNRWFKTSVELRNTTIDKARLEDARFDRAFSISVIEHLTRRDIREVMRHVYRSLKPGGLFILTIDLFLNLAPFTKRKSNEYGWNQDVRALVESQDWEIVVGRRDELFGFDAFDANRVQSHLEKFFIGYYPSLIQCVVLRKPAAG
jgi:SAM-dependent methyltransferase